MDSSKQFRKVPLNSGLDMQQIKQKEVIILGSGMSILNLSNKEKEYINNCEIIIAINKFMAFYKKAEILPTHVYFVDNYQSSTKLFLQHVFNVCRSDKLTNLNFIINKSFKDKIISNDFVYKIKKKYWNFKYGKISEDWDLFLVPQNCNFQFIYHQPFLEGDNWAKTLDESLFHYRGSLSTVLNYISIEFPSRIIKMIGVDFNSPEYFFQKELENLKFDWKDWTTSIVNEKKIHFSAIEYEGTTIFDKFEFMIENLKKSNNSLYSCSPESLLVTKGFVKNISITNNLMCCLNPDFID